MIDNPQVGMRVRWISNVWPEKIGMIGTITAIDNSQIYPLSARFDVMWATLPCRPHEMELYDPSPEAQAKWDEEKRQWKIDQADQQRRKEHASKYL